MNHVQEFNLKELIIMLKKHFWFIVIITVAAGLFSFSASKYLITPEYQSTAALIVNVNDNTSALVTYDDVTLSQKLVDTYVVILKNYTLLNKVIQKLGLNMSAASLAGNITVNTVSTTEILEITVQDTNALRAKTIVDTIVNLAPEEITRTVKAGSVEVISPAQVNNSPVSPNMKKNTLIGFLLGLLFSCSIAFILEILNNKFKTDDDVAEKLGYNVIGTIPNYRKIRGKRLGSKSDEPVVMLEKPPLQVAEAYHALRTNLEFLTHDKSIKKIIVTSSVAGEGKTTVAVNLAISLGQSGYKVLIMDLDLRKPSVSRLLRLKEINDKGVTMVLNGKSTPADSVINTENLSVGVMPSGPIPPNPNDLIRSNAMKNLLKELEGRYDYIIFDTPPVLSAADAISFSPMTDGILFVLKQNQTTFGTAVNARKSLAQVNANILGCILNDYDAASTDEYYSYYRKDSYR